MERGASDRAPAAGTDALACAVGVVVAGGAACAESAASAPKGRATATSTPTQRVTQRDGWLSALGAWIGTRGMALRDRDAQGASGAAPPIKRPSLVRSNI